MSSHQANECGMFPNAQNWGASGRTRFDSSNSKTGSIASVHLCCLHGSQAGERRRARDRFFVPQI